MEIPLWAKRCRRYKVLAALAVWLLKERKQLKINSKELKSSLYHFRKEIR